MHQVFGSWPFFRMPLAITSQLYGKDGDMQICFISKDAPPLYRKELAHQSSWVGFNQESLREWWTQLH